MPPKPYSLSYPRKQLSRFFVRLAGRLILPALFQIEITGREKFPRKGPLLVVGNHTAAMEAVMLNIYSPRPLEMLSAADMPAEKVTAAFSRIYGVIPLHRGSYDRAALTQALDVLKQEGFIGLFPEGGVWEEGKKKALPGIAWLSVQSGAPVLPIGFNDTTGALNAGMQFKRPKLAMHVGEIIAPAKLLPGKPRKEYLNEYAGRVMEAVHQLVPQDQYTTEPEIIHERFELTLSLQDKGGKELIPPENLQILEAAPLAKFFHRPAILKIFKFNLALPVDPFQNLAASPAIEDLILACQSVLVYLSDENPYLLTYRFGVREGLAMEQGIQELHRLLLWCRDRQLQITIQPIRFYHSIQENREIKQIEQGSFQTWM